MIREVILNSFASTLSKNDRDGLNSAARSLIANPKTFLDNKTFNEFQASWSIDFNKTTKRHFRMFKEGLRKVSKVKFANPELIFLTIQATDKYPFNIFIDDDLGKHYLEKAMGVVSLHYEKWEV